MNTSFRTRLRRETMMAHMKVDRSLSGLDIAQRRDFSIFLEIHLHCFEKMATAAPEGGRAAEALTGFIRRIGLDLDCLGAARSESFLPDLGPTDALALDYMIEGSRLGARVLKARWRRTEDPGVAGASAYFSAPVDNERWRDVCEELAAVPERGARADAIIDASRRTFALFEEASARLDGRLTPLEAISA